MAFESVVYRVLIASPSDVYEEREIATRVIQEWNDLNAFNKKIVLLPLRWETHTAPSFGERPQETINRQIVDECDLVIGFFWTRIGSPTGENVSGTIEEIKRAASNGKPVMLYFSKRGMDPTQISTEQLGSLNKFKETLYDQALIESFTSIVEFRDKLSRQLEIKIRELQENLDKQKSIDFALISGNSSKVIEPNQKITLERIIVSNDEYKQLKSSRNDISIHKLVREINSLREKHDKLPVVVNFKNNDNRIYSNINLELKIECNKTDALKIGRVRGADNNSITDKISKRLYTEEQESQLTKLYSSDIQKVSDREWEIQVAQFSLLPNKGKNIDPLLLFYPTENCKVKVQVRLISDNLFEILEFESMFEIIHKTRKLSTEEKNNSIESSIETDDDLPF